jgi:hypothetical protein
MIARPRELVGPSRSGTAQNGRASGLVGDSTAARKWRPQSARAHPDFDLDLERIEVLDLTYDSAARHVQPRTGAGVLAAGEGGSH